jgi:hypothetical protein
MVDAVKGWLGHPFSMEMDALHWALFLGFLLVLAGLWGRVLSHMGEGF